MYNRITNSFPKVVLRIYDLLYSHTKKVYFVGGCVRDALMGKACTDFDITLCMTPQRIIQILKDASFFPFMKNEKFGTVSVDVKEGNSLLTVEITPFRSEGDYRDFRHPQSIVFAQRIQDDLSRRDFTVNAIALSKEGVQDDFDGMTDMQNLLLRCVGDAKERFREDALRILRALRFCAQLGFEMEEQTEKALYECAHLLSKISLERKTAEIKKLLISQHAEAVLKKYYPILSKIIGEYTVDKAFSALSKDPLLRFFSLVCKNQAESRALCLSKKEKERLSLLFRAYSECENGLDKSVSKKERELILKYGAQTVTSLFDLFLLEKDALCEYLENGTYSLSRLCISGAELEKLGFRGREISLVLNEILKKTANFELENKKETLLAYAISFKNANNKG